jgi:hypothetical protein
MVSASEHEADLRSRGDDPTPRGVVRAVILAWAAAYVAWWDRTHDRTHDACLMIAAAWDIGLVEDALNKIEVSESRPFRLLDVCSGYGCWAGEFARWWVHVLGLPRSWLHITGVELDERKREHLAKWCDRAWCPMSWTELVPPECTRGQDLDNFDLAIGNPDFSQLTHDDPEQSMPAVLLRHAPAVLLLHTQQAFLKSEAGRAAWRAYPPAASWLIPGGVKFRGSKQGADSRCYQVTLWLRGHKGPCAVHLLDDLTPAERSWTTLPGTEDAETAKALGLPMVGER